MTNTVKPCWRNFIKKIIIKLWNNYSISIDKTFCLNFRLKKKNGAKEIKADKITGNVILGKVILLEE
jgi:plasmid maintenance system killer protein